MWKVEQVQTKFIYTTSYLHLYSGLFNDSMLCFLTRERVFCRPLFTGQNHLFGHFSMFFQNICKKNQKVQKFNFCPISRLAFGCQPA